MGKYYFNNLRNKTMTRKSENFHGYIKIMSVMGSYTFANFLYPNNSWRHML